MSDFDPYSVLGLKRGATRDQVRVAFRRLSKQHHPDAGGDPRQFAVLKSAHDLLVDEPRRAHWDRSGWDRGNDEQLRGQAIGALAGCLQAVLGGQDEPRLIDVVARMRAMVEDATNRQRMQVAQFKQILDRVDKMQGRFGRKKGKGASVLASLLDGQRGQLLLQVQNVERAILVQEEALRILRDETFDAEKMAQVSRYQTNTYHFQTFAGTSRSF